jgi:monoamine oxidase
MVRSGVSLAWPKIPYNSEAWAEWRPEQYDTVYKLRQEPDVPIVFTGEYLGYLSSWQEGAGISAHRAIESIVAKVRA